MHIGHYIGIVLGFGASGGGRELERGTKSPKETLQTFTFSARPSYPDGMDTDFSVTSRTRSPTPDSSATPMHPPATNNLMPGGAAVPIPPPPSTSSFHLMLLGRIRKPHSLTRSPTFARAHAIPGTSSPWNSQKVLRTTNLSATNQIQIQIMPTQRNPTQPNTST